MDEKKPKTKERLKPLSLGDVPFEEAVSDILKVKPPSKREKRSKGKSEKEEKGLP